jgi:hypothetical protein
MSPRTPAFSLCLTSLSMLRPKLRPPLERAIHRELAARVHTQWRLARTQRRPVSSRAPPPTLSPRTWTILHRLSEEHWRHLHKRDRRRSTADQRSDRILVAQTPSSKSCRPHRRDGNGQYGSPSLMGLYRRGHSCLSPFGVDHSQTGQCPRSN